MLPTSSAPLGRLAALCSLAALLPACTGFAPDFTRAGIAPAGRSCPGRAPGPPMRSTPPLGGGALVMQTSRGPGEGDERRRVHPNRQYVTPYEKRDLMGVPMETGVVGNPDIKNLRQKAMLATDDTASWQTLIPTEEEPLPDGWIAEMTPDGRQYYSHTVSGRVMTERPKRAAPVEDASAGAKARSRNDEEFVREWKEGSFADSIYQEQEVHYERDDTPLRPPNTEPAFDVWAGAHPETPAGLNSGGIDGTDTLTRAFSALYDADDEEELAPIMGKIPPQTRAPVPPSREELLRSQLSEGAVVKGSEPIPENLSPGNNIDQLNWAERQLRNAQQTNRPASDLPGFAKPAASEASPEVEEGSSKADDGTQIIPLWNPIPFKNPKIPRVGIRRDIYAKRPAAPAQEEKESEEERLAEPTLGGVKFEDDTIGLDVLDGIYDDKPEQAADYAFTNGEERSAPLVSMCQSTGRPKLRGETVDKEDRAFTFVDEHTCIGCTNCAMIARNTFFMEDMHGRARAYAQEGDAAEVVSEAVDSCPVDCIHPVTYEELQFVEDARQGDVINPKSRLVGGSYTADEKGGTPWMQLLAKRVRDGKATSILGF